jgi:hypothetical protein
MLIPVLVSFHVAATTVSYELKRVKCPAERGPTEI